MKRFRGIARNITFPVLFHTVTVQKSEPPKAVSGIPPEPLYSDFPIETASSLGVSGSNWQTRENDEWMKFNTLCLCSSTDDGVVSTLND